jgi:penicillin-binding protein 1A
MFSRFFMLLLSLGFIGIIVTVGAVGFILHHYSQDLPDYTQLKNYEPPIVTRAYAGDGRLMAEFAIEKRVFVPIRSIPKHVIDAFIAAEDQNFYKHRGVDYTGIARAIRTNLMNMGKNRRPVGASTITQQVAKNFLLTNELSFDRKIKEMLLAFRIEDALTKDQILELYLNEIYLGLSAYGVAAAAHEYFNKPLDKLSLEEVAYLAALPKAPNNYHPLRKTEAAVIRRNWVIDRMYAEDFITFDEAEAAKNKPLKVVDIQEQDYVSAPYIAEEIRRHLITTYGQTSLYKGGLLVKSTVEPHLQKIADQALRNGLIAYDRRHGMRESAIIARLENLEGWQKELKTILKPKGAEDWPLAAVLKAESDRAIIGFEDGTKGIIPLKNVTWARKKLKDGLGPEIKNVFDVLNKGMVILVERDDSQEQDADKTTKDDKAKTAKAETAVDEQPYHFRQIPDVQGGLVALDPHTGRVLAMAGGFSYEISEFNRVTQALRQPGSAFKPFVYYAALEKGFTPSTLIMDAPITLSQGPGLEKWRPTNYKDEYFGPTTMRVGLEKSRNLMTIRLAMSAKMENIERISKEFGVSDSLPYGLATSLGSGETTLLRMASAYAVFANGGRRVEPSVIDRIQDRSGKTIYTHDKRDCSACGPLIPWTNKKAEPPILADMGVMVADPKLSYQIVSMLEGAVQRGTATSLKALNRPVAGKTGTTNESKDTWFIGFTPDLVVGAYVGFDDPRPMGSRETGGRVAVPIVKEFMTGALADVPPTSFRIPDGIKLVLVNAKTGARANSESAGTIWEAFVDSQEPGLVPSYYSEDTDQVIEGESIPTYTPPPAATSGSGQGASIGTGGLY